MPGTVTASNPLSIVERLTSRNTLIGLSEAAELLGESYTTTYRRARSGKIPHLRFGTTIKFDPRELAIWIRGHHIAREE